MSAGVVKALSAVGGLLLTVVLLIVIMISGDPIAGCAVAAPMGQGMTGTPGSSTPVSLAGYDTAQLDLAREIVAVGERRGIPESGITAALMAATTESELRNYANSGVPESLSYPHDATGTDHDSVGPFQLRASVWSERLGGMAGLMTPARQIGWFYDQLDTVPSWQTRAPAALAQAVERSAYPDAYAGKRDVAEALYRAFRGAGAGTAPAADDGTSCASEPETGGTGSGFGARVLAAAMAERGLPYVWGGGNASGPTGGGFDCSGLVLYGVAQASGGRIVLDHYTGSQQRDPRGIPVPLDQLQPGDAVYFTSPGDTDSHHVGLYAGTDSTGHPLILNAPDSGIPVRVQPMSDFASDHAQARRFGVQQQDTDHRT
ncbi:C40 family peptidase [Nocardia alni]|uniref:C40 family peptidase n=1 Tax=Nocardia alni TaxID=2815723 RepID=UPI001C246B53|nr:NlpC/P60 family protein [Nocardia alni]